MALNKPYEAVFFELCKDWKEITDELFEEGAHYIEAHVAIGLGAIENKQLLDNVEEYRIHFLNGMRKAESHWMKWARDNVSDKNVNTNLYKIMVKRFYEWDKIVDKLELPDNTNEIETQNSSKKFTEKFLSKEN